MTVSYPQETLELNSGGAQVSAGEQPTQNGSSGGATRLNPLRNEVQRDMMAEHGNRHSPPHLQLGVLGQRRPQILVPFADLYQWFDITGEINTGGEGVVFAARRKYDQQAAAIKIMSDPEFINSVDGPIPRQFQLQQQAQRNNPGVSNVMNWVTRVDQVALISERMHGKTVNLFEVIHADLFLNETFVKIVFKQLVQTTKKCHENGIVHGDIKDENVLISLNSGEVRLVEFDSASSVQDADLFECEAEDSYSPPEWFLRARYNGRKRDVWSLGVLLYQMIECELPFKTNNEIMQCRFDLSATNQQRMSAEFKLLITQMLQPNENERPSLEEVLAHEWFNNL